MINYSRKTQGAAIMVAFAEGVGKNRNGQRVISENTARKTKGVPGLIEEQNGGNPAGKTKEGKKKTGWSHGMVDLSAANDENWAHDMIYNY